MPKIAGEKLRKVTLNLYDTDVEDLGALYGYGWSEVVRDLVRKHVIERGTRTYTIGEAFGQRD